MDAHSYVQRAKVYRLNDEGSWDDKGTGHVSIKYLERSEAAGLIVIDEDDNSTLLVHRISTEDIYRRTEDTIISWRDPEVATDLALSFQEAVFCSYIWGQICDIQRSVPTGALDGGPRASSEVLENLTTSRVHDGLGSDAVELPAVEISSLPQILKVLTDATVSFIEREQLVSLILSEENFLFKLGELFTICEDVEDIESLRMLFKIAKAIISLNDSHIFDIIFSDKLIMDIIGMLEYDPDVATRQNHRLFLKEQVVYKEAVPIPDPGLLMKIHQTYILGYIKDVILPNVLDNPMLASINGMILNNNLIVMTALVDHSTFITRLFTMLKSQNTNDSAKKDLVRFIQEFCSLSKTLQLPLRSRFFSSCVQEGLFDVVTDLLGSTDENFRLIGTDILIVVLNNYEPSALRNFLIYQQDYTLFSYLVSGILTPGQGGVPCQLLEVMRMLLDYDATERTPPENSSFLEVFYGKYMNQIMEALALSVASKKNSVSKKDSDKKSGQINAEILGNICELLCFCVQHHGYRIKYYVMRNQVLEKVLQLTKRREKHLVVAAIRFLRMCIGRKDEFYYRYIVKNDLFAPVVQVFLANGGRYNLLDSAVLELFNSIMENAKTLVVYAYEKYYDKLENIEYVNTFKKLKMKYDQSLEGQTTKGRESLAVNMRDRSMSARDRMDNFIESRRRKDERALDKDEEEYFNEDSDDEEDSVSVQKATAVIKPAQAVIVNGSSLSGTFGLVDYDDEDEDVPPARNNGGDEIHENDVPQATSPKDSVWLDPEEDKMIQNAKRKSLTTNQENEELLKRRKSCTEASCIIEERPCAVKVINMGKPDKSSTHVQDDKPCNKITAGLSHSTDSDNMTAALESVDSVTNG